jgi:kynurenine 3-monooxygenase
MKSIIVGGGLVGSLWAVYLGKLGHEVTIYERRSDMRLLQLTAGKSINLAMSKRGWKALEMAGIDHQIRKIGIPMKSRAIHDLEGNITYQPYGNFDQAIYSVSRGELNCLMMDLAEEKPEVNFVFHHTLQEMNATEGKCTFWDSEKNQEVTVHADLIFASDGAFSAARYKGFQKLDRFNFSQEYIADGYKEILLPTEAGKKLDRNALHIWPKGRFMLIALPNMDDSYTCTLFMPLDNEEYAFSNLEDRDSIDAFFKEVFPDFHQLMPDVADHWDDYPTSSLVIIRCFPWSHGKAVLMGDAAHATVPFYGQGMNCGFEDCSVMWELIQQYPDDWEKVFKEYEISRKPNGDAMQDLSKHNYIVMRDLVADPDFRLLQKVERRINYLYPDQYFPLYSMVSFTDISYSDALEKGLKQEKFVKQLIAENNISQHSSESEIDHIIHQKIGTLSSI